MSEPDEPDNVVSLFGGSRPSPTPQDPRQAGFREILGNLGSATGLDLRGPNLQTGFRASAVDLGRLQELLEQPLRGLAMDELRRRWKDDLLPAAEKTVLGGVQRVKELRFEVRDNGVNVQLQTQDDRGYYRYSFDIFPGR